MKDVVSYLVSIEARLAIRRTLVLVLAVWMTWRAYNRGEEIWIYVE